MGSIYLRDPERSPAVHVQGKIVVVAFVTFLLIFSAAAWVLIVREIIFSPPRHPERDAELGLTSIPEEGAWFASGSRQPAAVENADMPSSPTTPTTYQSPHQSVDPPAASQGVEVESDYYPPYQPTTTYQSPREYYNSPRYA
ncbi:hypothetical protein M426DRAFT_15312 [Hypoxylon sp. CI-4A]|nr:hypothetical protein M426DRAFT_15312 [Hypoxylon sp. CI-4A]